jgi:hypothetical protein
MFDHSITTSSSGHDSRFWLRLITPLYHSETHCCRRRVPSDVLSWNQTFPVYTVLSTMRFNMAPVSPRKSRLTLTFTLSNDLRPEPYHIETHFLRILTADYPSLFRLLPLYGLLSRLPAGLLESYWILKYVSIWQGIQESNLY